MGESYTTEESNLLPNRRRRTPKIDIIVAFYPCDPRAEGGMIVNMDGLNRSQPRGTVLWTDSYIVNIHDHNLTRFPSYLQDTSFSRNINHHILHYRH